MWHSRLAKLEVDAQDLEKPEDAAAIAERLAEVQHLHSQLSKQAELRTALIGKVSAQTRSTNLIQFDKNRKCVSAQIEPWLQEHQEMMNSSTSWLAEAQSWLAAPCTYTTAKCLSSRVQALQVGP